MQMRDTFYKNINVNMIEYITRKVLLVCLCTLFCCYVAIGVE